MDEKLKNQFNPVINEMYQLLLSSYCCEKKLSHLSERLDIESEEILLEEALSLHQLANAIILHICRLDDDEGDWSIRVIAKSMEESNVYAERTEECNGILSKYRSQINNFKTKYQIQSTSLQSEGELPFPFDTPDYRNDLREIIQTALSSLQHVWGSSLEFGFYLGSKNPTVDFKKALGVI